MGKESEVVTFGCRLNIYESEIIKQNLEKEAFEEAGIKILEKDLTIGNTFSYIHNHDHQIHSGTIFVYDYKIDQNIVLKNNDGEVQKFETICATEIDRILEKKLLLL